MRGPRGSRQQKLSWVSKGDVTGFVRCPYAWWLIDTGQISAEEAFSPLQAELAAAGIEFEAGVVAGAQPITIPAGKEKEVLQGDLTLFSNRLFRHDALRLRGRPEGMVSAGGTVEPIEIKSHRRVSHVDLLELAFYWRLLEPLRSTDAEPAGWVFLRASDGSVTRERVTINPEVFSELDELIAAVRQARVTGVEPTVYCRCAVCGGLRRDTVLRAAMGAKDVSTIWGVGRTYRTALSAAGVGNWDQLIASDAEMLAAQVRASDPRRCAGVTPPLVRRWQAHAKALESGEPVWVDAPGQFPIGDRYIALDLEYISDTMEIWLIGARVVNPGGHVTFSCWSDPAGNREAFAAFAELLQRFEALPVVTYNGLSADLPALRAATSRCDSEHILELVDGRHVDVYDWLSSRLMLPVLDFGLKDISHHAGITREAGVTSGFEATQMYRQYRLTGDPALRDRLLDYNRDDIDGLVQGIEYLRRLIEPSDAGPYQLARASEMIDLAFELPLSAAASARVVGRPARTGSTRDEVLAHARGLVAERRRSRLTAHAAQGATTTVQPPSTKPPATPASPSIAKPRWTCPTCGRDFARRDQQHDCSLGHAHPKRMNKPTLIEHLVGYHHPDDLAVSDTSSLSEWKRPQLHRVHFDSHQRRRVRAAPPPARTRADLKPGQYAYEISLIVHRPEGPSTYKFTFFSERRLLEIGALATFTPHMLKEVFGSANPADLPRWGVERVEEFGSPAG